MQIEFWDSLLFSSKIEILFTFLKKCISSAEKNISSFGPLSHESFELLVSASLRFMTPFTPTRFLVERIYGDYARLLLQNPEKKPDKKGVDLVTRLASLCIP